MDVTKAQWAVLEPLVPNDNTDSTGRAAGGSKASFQRDSVDSEDGRAVERPSPKTRVLPDLHRRFQEWEQAGVMRRILCALADDLRDRGKLGVSECFVDATFASAKKGAMESATPPRAKGVKIMAMATAMVFLSPSAWKALEKPR